MPAYSGGISVSLLAGIESTHASAAEADGAARGPDTSDAATGPGATGAPGAASADGAGDGDAARGAAAGPAPDASGGARGTAGGAWSPSRRGFV